ncbi:Bug family tripartite tricarboxylate transporter substrate binding protein [Ottowia thiooxydans]
MKKRNFIQSSALALGAALSLSALGTTATLAAETQFPTKTVRILVGFAPGGSADKLSRALSQKLSERWGQTVVVENVSGAGGTLAVAAAARAAPDGYTLLLSGTGNVLSALHHKDLAHNTIKDFTGVAKAAISPQLIAVSPKLGVKNFQEYVALLKKRPGQVTIGLPDGIGGLQHLAHEIISKQIGASPNYIPYPGGGPATLDVLGGHIDGEYITLAAVTDHVRSGKLIGLGVSTATRSPALPDVPTIAESGVPGYVVDTWQGFVAPKGTPKATVDKLNRDINSVLQQPEVRAQLEGLGFTVVSNSKPAEVDKALGDEYDRYSKILAETGIKLK